MKKLFCFLPIVIALMLAACSTTDEVEVPVTADQIVFRPMITTSTRGTVIDATNFREFFVKASPVSGVPADYVAWQDYVKSTDGTVWNTYSDAAGTTSDRHLWPASGTLKFEAYAPSNLVDNYKVKEFPADQEDVIVAYEEGSKAVNAATGIPLYFRHTMSQIVVQATNMDTENYEVKVLGVKIVNLNSKCTLTHPSSSTGSNFSWTTYTPWPTASLSAPNSYMNKAGGAPTASSATISNASQAITLNGTATDITFGNGPMLLLPQQLVAADLTDVSTIGTYLSVLLQIKTKQIIYDANNSIRFNADEVIYPRPKTAASMDYLADPDAAAAAVGGFGFAAVPINTKLEPGYKYTYTLNFFAPNGGGCGMVDPNPANPDDRYKYNNGTSISIIDSDDAHFPATGVNDPDVDLNPGIRNPTDPTKPYDPTNNQPYNESTPGYYNGTTTVAPTDNLKPGDEIVSSDRPIYFTVTVEDWQNTTGGSIDM